MPQQQPFDPENPNIDPELEKPPPHRREHERPRPDKPDVRPVKRDDDEQPDDRPVREEQLPESD